MKKFELFGIKISLYEYDSLVNTFIESKPISYCCVNQFYLNRIYTDKYYKYLIQQFDLIHPDGIGVYLAIRFLSESKINPPKITGSDLYWKIIKEIETNNLSLYILGDSQDVLIQAMRSIKEEYPNIRFVGSHHGYIEISDPKIIDNIAKSKPDVIFVGLGINKQEEWINKWKFNFPNSRIIAIGGGLRVIGEDRPRGPKFIQKMGLEWLIRLIYNPKQYWKRYLIGIPLFIFRIIKEKFKQNK